MRELLSSWIVHLRAERKSDETIRNWKIGVNQFYAWCDATGRSDELTRENVAAFISDLLKNNSAATAAARWKAMRYFTKWLCEEGELDRDTMDGLKMPKVDVPVVPVLTAEQVNAMIKACRERNEFVSRRDEAIIRLMVETGARIGEVVALTVNDVDVAEGVAAIRRGKGGRGRVVPFGPETARSIDRYLRLRRSHVLANSSLLWLGSSGKTLQDRGLRESLKRRAATAGLSSFHPHMLRHTFADRWLNAGGTEGSLMAIGGWRRRDMLDRYGSSNRSARAVEEARRLSLGSL